MCNRRPSSCGSISRVLFVVALGVTMGAIGCSAHDASDPEYGAMFKQTTKDRVQGTEFWGASTQKDCTVGTAIEVCTPKTVSESSK